MTSTTCWGYRRPSLPPCPNQEMPHPLAPHYPPHCCDAGDGNDRRSYRFEHAPRNLRFHHLSSLAASKVQNRSIAGRSSSRTCPTALPTCASPSSARNKVPVSPSTTSARTWRCPSGRRGDHRLGRNGPVAT